MDRKMSEQKLNIEFVKEVEKYPCIYDYRRSDYSSKEVIDKAWATIGEKINLSGPQCRERWKNLRTVLSRNLRPSEKNAQRRSLKQQRKPYYLFDAMQFAVPFIKRHSTVPPLLFLPKESSNSASDQEMKVEDCVEENICLIKEEVPDYNQSRSPSPQYSSPPPPLPKVSLLEAKSLISTTPPNLESTGITRKRKMTDDTSELEEKDNIIRTESRKNKKIKHNKNKIKLNLTRISKKRFLLSLLSDVYAMDDNQMRSFRIKVLNVINDITITPSSVPSGEVLCSGCQKNNVSPSEPAVVPDQPIEIRNTTPEPQNVFYPSVKFKKEK